MTNIDVIKRELATAIASINICIPLLESLKGKIPSDILDDIDYINKFSVMF